MAAVSSAQMQMPALGRPFNLGMLYDARTDELIPGMTLWDNEKLIKDMTERPQPNSEFEIVASESISDKSSSLGVDASLKASFFCGLIKVDGSAKYLKDTRTSKQQARVTLKYKTTTRFRQLTMNQLGTGNIKHPYVFDKGLATHVVTGILYGAQAFFVFDREVSDSENIQDIQGNLQVMIKKIPSISIEGQGALKMEDKDRDKVNKFSCKFHGDFNLPQSPMTFEDAVNVYKDLPKLLGPDGEKAVPVTVWLLPLTKLHSKAAQLVRQISVGLVFEVERTLEHLADLDMRCWDILKNAAVQQFPQISTKIRTFMSLCSQFNLELQGILAQKLPVIRGGGENEAELADILKKRAASPFNHVCLDQWVTCKVKEINHIKTFTNMMKHTEVLSSQEELDATNHNIKYAVCFVFTSLETEEEYLSALDQYLKGASLDQNNPQPKDLEKQQWYSKKDVRDAVRTKVKLFADFAEANKDNEDVKFMAVAFKDDTHKGSTIYTYEDGFDASDDFVPPSKPEVKVGVVTHNSVTLCVSAPTWGAEAVTGYRLQYSENEESSANGEWEQQSVANTGLTTVTGLNPDTEYTFRLRALTEMGQGPMNELTKKTCPAPEGPRRLALNKTEPKSLEVQLWRVQRSAVDLTLDPDTAHPDLVLSEDLKQVHDSDVRKQLPDYPQRFNRSPCVLGKQGFSSGRFYFEVQVKGKTEWDVGVAQESITRKGPINLSPKKGIWCITQLNKDKYRAYAVPSVPLSLQRPPQKVGVFVDHEEALVSFYDVHSADLLYSFTGCSFTETLFPFFSPGLNRRGSNCAPLVLSVVDTALSL